MKIAAGSEGEGYSVLMMVTPYLDSSLPYSMSPLVFKQLGLFFVALFFFHVSEYVLALFIHGRSNVNHRSFLITKQYIIAMTVGVIEYGAEYILFPGLKELWWLSDFGLVLIVSGELLRKTGILTASHAFTHDIKVYHQDEHHLVTHGVYRYEEFFLRQFFGDQHAEYTRKVPSGILFIK